MHELSNKKRWKNGAALTSKYFSLSAELHVFLNW